MKKILIILTSILLISVISAGTFSPVLVDIKDYSFSKAGTLTEMFTAGVCSAELNSINKRCKLDTPDSISLDLDKGGLNENKIDFAGIQKTLHPVEVITK